MRFSIPVVLAAMVLSAPAAQAATAAYDEATQLELDAMDLQQKGDFDNALAKYRQAVQVYPKDKAFKDNLIEALNAAGVAKYQAKDYAAAIADFQEALSLRPGFDKAKANLAIVQADQLNGEGMTLFKNGDFAGAVEKFKQALAAQPDNKSALCNRDAAEAEIMMTGNDPDGAVAKLQEALTVQPNSAFLQGRLAKAQDAAAAKAKAEAEAKAKEGKTH